MAGAVWLNECDPAGNAASPELDEERSRAGGTVENGLVVLARVLITEALVDGTSSALNASDLEALEPRMGLVL